MDNFIFGFWSQPAPLSEIFRPCTPHFSHSPDIHGKVKEKKSATEVSIGRGREGAKTYVFRFLIFWLWRELSR